MAMMISKFNKLIHNKTVWLVFAILISVAFVGVYTGQKTNRNSDSGKDPAKIVAGRLWGEDVSRQEFGQAYTGVYVMYSMMMGRPINITGEIDKLINQAAWQRLATLKKAEQMNLTYTPEQVRDLIQRQPLFMNQQTGGFDKNMYDMFVTQFLARNRISQKTFEQLMAENVLIEKASAVATQGALVTEEEIKERFHLYNDKITVEYTTLPRSIAGTPEVSEEEAKAYYDKNPEEFRLPEKAIVKYVAFNVTDYTNQVSVTEEMIASVYENNKQQFVKPETVTNAVPEFKTLEEVRGDIVERMTAGLANQQAFNAADAMVASLADEVTTFEQAAEKAGREIVSNLPAFAATDRVRGIDPSAPFAQKAFTLNDTPAHYYSDPVRGRDTIYVIALEKKLPAFLPAFDVVKADVTESAKIVAAERVYVDKAAEIHAGVEAALKAGISFADAAGKFTLETKTTAAFNASSPIVDEYARELMGATLQYDAGTLIDLINTPEDFLMAYVASKELADEEQTLPSMRNEIAESLRQEKTARLTQAWQESLLDEAGFEDLTEEKPGKAETTSES